MKLKRILGVSLLSLISLTGCSVSHDEEVIQVQKDNKQQLNISQADLIADITDNVKYLNEDLLFNVSTLEDDDKIGAIVTLDNEGLMDSYQENSRGYSSIGDYVNSTFGVREASVMESNQQALANKLKNKGLISSVKYSYTTLFNGFAVETTYGNFKKMERLGMVGDVSICEVYAEQKVEKSSAGTAVENIVDVYETGIFNSSTVDYDGSGTAVAILDSGFDTYHQVFQNMPDSILFNKEYVESKLPEMTASSFTDGLMVEDVYYNDKIPFAYDYADKDYEVNPLDSDHGTHVAGIIGGSCEEDNFKGVAINTQMVLMKVFGDVNNGARSEDILAALEDAVILDVDAINLSLGTSCGFSRSSDNEYINEVYDKIEAAGISMIVAASNDYSSGYGGAESNTNKASNPDSASVGSPGTYTTALSVASISGVKSKYITHDDGYVFFFNEANSAGTEQYDFYEMIGIEEGKDVEIEYVVVPGFGKKVNYSTIDVKNKIALVKRGETSFEEKAQMAYEAGAAGCIIYNNIGGDIYMSAGNDLKIPLCSISKDDGEYLAKKGNGVLVFNTGNLAGPFMSDFSSWGPNPDLSLKPEITAHGGTITSSVPGGAYDEISGTSMACPNLCGIVILIRQHLKEKYPEMSRVEIMRMTNQLLMSTTTIALDKSGNPYSPRKQGSGLANLMNAVNTKAYITVDGSDKTKIELFDDPKETGVYTLRFNIVNLSNESLTYDLSNLTMTESLSTADSRFVAEKAYMLNPSTKLSIKGEGTNSGNKITVNPNGTVSVEYELKLSNEEKRYLRESFKNGMYVEGFATLASCNEDDIDLSIPFLAFFGDWTVAPMFDKTYYEVESETHDGSLNEEDKLKADYYATTPLGTYYYSYIIPMGTYVYDIDKSKYDAIPATEAHAAMGYTLETINGITSVYAGLLRNAKKMTTTITNVTTGEVVYEHVKYDQLKAHYSGGQIPAYDLIEVTAAGLGLDNNVQYRFTMNGELDYGDGGVETNLNNTFSFDFYCDFEAPVLTNAEYYAKYDKVKKENRYYVDFYVYDNHYAQSIKPFVINDGEIAMLAEFPTPIYSEMGEVTKVTLEITDYMDLLKFNINPDDQSSLGNGLGIMVDDYALNANYYYVTLQGTNADVIEFQDTKGELMTSTRVKVGEEVDLTQYIWTNDEDFDIENIGQKDYLRTLNWKSSDESIVRVNGGRIEGINPGRATITVSTRAANKYNLNQSDYYTHTASINIIVPKNNSTDLNEGFTNDVKLEEIEFKYFDTIKAFIDGPDMSEIGETGERIFLTNTPSISFYPSEEIRLGYEIKPWNLDPSRYTLEWVSSRPQVASVDQTGKVTALKEGSSTITLRITVDGKQSVMMASCRVTVKSEFVIENRVLLAYKGFGGDVLIPDDEGIMYIESFAFSLYTTDLEVKVEEEDYDKNKTPGGHPDITSVTIPYDVQEVRKYAFYNCPKLEKVTFEEGPKGEIVPFLRESAFEGCSNLKDINLEKIEVIGKNCFKNCTSLEEVDLSSCYSIAEKAFYGCTSLKSVDITKLRNPGKSAFENCTNLETVITGEFTRMSESMFKNSGVTEISFNADRIPASCFEGCTKLTKVEVNNDIIYIGQNAFKNCTNLVSYITSNGAEYIYDSAFENCSNLETVYLPNSNVNIYSSVFKGCSKLINVHFNEKTYIQSNLGNVFNDCELLVDFKVNSNNAYYAADGSYLVSNDMKYIVLAAPGINYGNLRFSDKYIKILDSAFSGISSITSIVFSSSIQNVGDHAFENCKNLKTVNLATMINYGTHVFNNCTSLSEVYGIELLEVVEDYMFANTAIESLAFNCDVVIDEGAFSNNTKLANVTFNGTATLGEGAFANCSKLSSVSTNYDINLNDYAFANCNSLETFNFENIIGIVSQYSFANCSSLTEINLEKAESIYDYAFYGCTGISSILIPNVEVIGDYAFSNIADSKEVNKITEIYAPKLNYIGAYAFNNNSNLLKITTSDSLNYIGDYAFYGCTALEEFNSNGTVSTIYPYTFALCSSLKEITLTGIEYVDEAAFYGNSSLTSIDLTNALEIGNYAFEDCSSITEINLPKATLLAECAFNNAKNVTTVNIPSAVEIGYLALSRLSVTEIEIPNTISYISERAFYRNRYQTKFTSEGSLDATINNYVVLDNGVLYTITANGNLELNSYPTGKTDSKYEIIEDTVRIAEYAAGANPNLDYVVLPNTLKSIGNFAFTECQLETVEFKSTVAPVLEGTPTESDFNYTVDSEIYEILTTFYPLNGYYPFYNAQFNNMVGIAKKMNIVLPSNNVEGYDNIIYKLYFNLDSATKSDYIALDKYSLDYLDKIALVPYRDDVKLSDEKIIQAARGAYNLVTQDLTQLGYDKSELDDMYNNLVEAEKAYLEIKMERINKIYGHLIESIEALGTQFDYSKISLYNEIVELLEKVDREDIKYIDEESVEEFKDAYNEYFKNLNETIKVMESTSTLPTTKVNKVGLIVNLANSISVLAAAAFTRKFWF